MCPKPKTEVSYHDKPTGGKKKILFLVVPLIALGIGIYRQQRVDLKEKSGSILPTPVPKHSGVPDCIPPAINEFPDDIFTQEQRQSGFVIIHIVATAYLCLVLAIICDQFFVPTLEIIAEALNVPVDVAGATFMAIGTSSPELYSAVIGSFVTKGDIGIGTIVGSAVFNILGVTSVTGLLLWKQESPVDWFPISRDCLVYIFSVTTLICIIQDNVVTGLESVLLLVMFAVYIAVMYFNSSIREWGEGTMDDLHRWWKKSRRARATSFRHRRPSLSLKASRIGDPRLFLTSPLAMQDTSVDDDDSDLKDTAGDDNQSDITTSSEESDLDDDLSPWTIPQDSGFQFTLWVITWPALVIITSTIPSCRKPNQGNFVITFICSVIWIGVISYLCSWMVTIISHTFGLPDSVAGITILAAGISVPEIIASVIVVKNGMANMAICNLIGSNIFDILFCLGVPWFIKTFFFSPTSTVIINSSALTYTTATLLSTVILLFVTFSVAGWKLNWKVGLMCLVLYLGFLIIACMFELNMFGDMNPAACQV
ncbi:sodium/potassium/calcium exchanger 4-like [Uloborus diversus]|uniref:sodium/potassium/calcium exchanger 4-like n=1 Tax=Uloborus diversus TaxID=327109 RepID=UPI0024094736|nr:sodium/potassium/calcium exchanger 4-like [Uloborus diversus]